MRFVSAVYDTGARYTCFRASAIDTGIKEDDCKEFESKYLSGFIGDSFSKFYKYRIDKLAYGTIDLGEQYIWLTFDENVTTNVVGYDIIKQVSRLSIANEDKEMFFGDVSELKQFVNGI